jgi:hypothetical protein
MRLPVGLLASRKFTFQGHHLPIPVKNYPHSKVLPELPTSLQLYSVAEVAIILDAQVEVVHKWIEAGLLPGIRLGSELHGLRVKARDLENFIDKYPRGQTVEPARQKIQG